MNYIQNPMDYYGGYSQPMPFNCYSPWNTPLYLDSWAHNSPFLFNRLFDRFTPKIIINNITAKEEKTFSPKKLVKRNGKYYFIERNSREISIGKLNIKDKYIVNQKPDSIFEAFICKVEFNETVSPVSIVIPYKDFVKRDILKYLVFRDQNVDCPDKYLIAAFYRELKEGDDYKFLQLPQSSGWHDVENNKAVFVSSEIVIPELEKYYSYDILSRKMLNTSLTLTESAKIIADYIPSCWQYKLLLMLRVTSLLLFFYKKAGLTPDQIFIVEPKSESNSNTAVALLKNKSYTNTSVCSLSDCNTVITKELNTISDGIALFEDLSYTEDRQKRDNRLDILIKDLTCQTGDEEPKRHLITVITNSPESISSEIPAYFISLCGCPDINNTNELHRILGEFESALIRQLSNSEVTDNIVTTNLNKTSFIQTNINASEFYMSDRMLRTSMEILFNYGVISSNEKTAIIAYLKKHDYDFNSTEQSITNEFRKVLSHLIESNQLKIVKQNGFPYYDSAGHTAIVDSHFINLVSESINRHILPLMKKTQKRNKLLSALKACGKLHSNNNFKRNIEVEVAPGINETVGVYSIPIDILTEKCKNKINALQYSDYLFYRNEQPDGFIPLGSVNDNMNVGRVINEMYYEAEGIYVSGKTQFGKTFYVIQQAIARAKNNHKIVIIDQTGAFSQEELSKHLPDKTIKNYFSYWDIGKYGIPVDLLSLKNCSNLPEKKNRLFSILSVGARVTGEVQGKVLKRVLRNIVDNISKGNIKCLSDIIPFFDSNDEEQLKLRDRLTDVFDDIEGLNTYEQNWGEFLCSQKSIVILSTAADSVHKGSEITDMLLASLYEYKQHHQESRYAVIIDEIEDLCLDRDGPICVILRKGTKHNLTMILASQEFSVEKDKLGRLIGNCGIQVIFHPKDANLSSISRFTGIDKSTLANMKQGECVIVGGMYNKNKKTHINRTILCHTYIAYHRKIEKNLIKRFSWK